MSQITQKTPEELEKIANLRSKQSYYSFEPGTILIRTRIDRYSSTPLIIKVIDYIIEYHQYKERTWETLDLIYLEGIIDEESNLTFSEELKKKEASSVLAYDSRVHAYRELNYDLKELNSFALNVLAGRETENIKNLIAENSDNNENSQSTEIMGRSSKAYYEAMLEHTNKQQDRIEVAKILMEVEIQKQMNNLEFHKEQAMALVTTLMKKVKKIMRVITTIELYLGVEEQITQIQSGEPASIDELIQFRQRVLFMDEEIAVSYGFDFVKDFDVYDIESFDKWLLEGNNIDIILPEKKGIVCLIPRRTSKNYGTENWILEKQLNSQNLNSVYYLIRDGENIYRIYTDKLGTYNKLFPKKNELQEIFEKMSDSYHSQEKAEDTIYYYRTRVAFLQGLLERTNVFGQVKEKINLFNLTESTSQLINFIYDDDDNLLSDGRITFKEWKEEINSNITIGSRVLNTGHYDCDGKKRFFVYYNEYNYPSLPPQGLYIVEKPAKEQRLSYWQGSTIKTLCIRYNPKDEIGRSGWTWDPHIRKNRVSFGIFPSDSFILEFDSIKLEDVEYYLHNRSHRREYLSMLPVLETIIKLKKEEAAEEAPFVQLVIDEATRNRILVTEEEVKDAIIWWKTKNKYKRAITVDDAKALRMIIKYLKKL